MEQSPTVQVQKNTPHFPFIDGLRGMAILGVMFTHLASSFIDSAGPGGKFRTALLLEFAQAGARGVQLFFMLSAFTLFASSKIRFMSDPLPSANFYIRRGFRILPLWWVATALYAHLTGCGLRGWLPSALMYFGFIRFRDGVEVFPMGWSIFVEETFYVMLPLIFTRIYSLRRSIIFVVASCMVSILWDQLASKWGVPNNEANAFIFRFPLNQWFCIAIGISIFYLSEEPLFQELIVNNHHWAWIFDTATAVILFALIRQPHMVASFGLAVLFIMCMSPHTLFGKIARHRLLGSFGICCYSIYLFHDLILKKFYSQYEQVLLAIGLGHATADFRFLIALPFYAFVCLIVGLTCWHGFERPCIALGRKINVLLSHYVLQ